MTNSIVTWLRANAGSFGSTAWGWATTAWGCIPWAVLAVWRSFAALLKSPAAWLACIVVFVVGFSAGHIERGSAIRPLKMTISGLEHDKSELQRQLDASQTKVRMLADQLQNLAQKPQEAAPLVSAPTPAERPRRILRAKPTPAKAIPAPVFRNPFGE